MERKRPTHLAYFTDSATMEDPTSSTPDGQNRTEELARLLKQQRGSVEQFLAVQRERLDRADSDLADRVRHRQGELDRRRSQIEAAEAKLQHDLKALALAQDQHQLELEQLSTQREQVEQKQIELEKQREELAARRVHTEGQRRRIAREFSARQAAHRKELDRRQAEIDDLATTQLARLNAQLADVTRQRGQLRQELAEAPQTSGGDGTDSDEDYQRLYEMALDDIRELKAQNEEQKKQLAGACTSGAAAAANLGGALDWEAQKRRILAALESDFDQNDEQSAGERLKIERVIRTTEQALAAKQQEIARLQKQFDEQAAGAESTAQEHAAAGEILDNNEVVQKERAALSRLQEEIQEKLRKAEVEISIERAKIARERAEIEEKLRVIGKKQTNEEIEAGSPADSNKPARGRWLAHLGIKDIED